MLFLWFFHTFQEIAIFAIKSSDLKINVLTPPAALFEVILTVLTPLGNDFVAQVAPTWALGPSPTHQKPLFSGSFHTFQEIATFAMKSPMGPMGPSSRLHAIRAMGQVRGHDLGSFWEWIWLHTGDGGYTPL